MSTEQAWQEIEGLVEEIADLAKTDLPVRDFYAELLDRAVRALAAVGGAVWIFSEGRLQLEYQIHFAKTNLDESSANQTAHATLLMQALQSNTVKAVPPQSGFDQGEQATNPTDFLLVLGPVVGEHQTEAVIEIVQRPDTPPSAHRGYVHLVEVLCEVAADYHRSRQYYKLQDRQSLWRQFDQFAQRVNRNLDLASASYTIVNEGRRTIDCDRVSLLTMQGNSCRVRAVSGLDRVNRRSNVIRHLQRLTKTIVAIDEPLWYTGDATSLPPQIETPLQAYLDESHARTLIIVPLKSPKDEEDTGRPSRTIGVLVVESFQASDDDESFRHRVDTVCRHSACALNNALVLYHIPLGSFLLPLGRARGWLRGRKMIWVLLGTMVLAAVVAALCLVEADFTIEGRGELQPVFQRHVFAPQDGIVDRLDVQRHAVDVFAGKSLMQLQDTALQYEKAKVVGELATARKKLDTAETLLNGVGNGNDKLKERGRLAAEVEELAVTIAGLVNQRDLLIKQEDELLVRSDIDGQILTWNFPDLLQSRPVRRGQSLLTVANLVKEWGLEVRVPDQHIGYVLDAQKNRDEKLNVSFLLKSDPNVFFRGTVKDISMATETDSAGESTVLVTISLAPNQKIPRLRPGASVIAKIQCGRRPLGYVWLHDLIEAVRTRILF